MSQESPWSQAVWDGGPGHPSTKEGPHTYILTPKNISEIKELLNKIDDILLQIYPYNDPEG